MSFHGVGIQINAQAWLIVDTNESFLDVWPIYEQQLIHPVAQAGNRLARNIIANRTGPLAGGPGVELASRIVGGHRQAVDIGEICDTLGFEETAAVAEVRVQNVRSLIDDEILKPLPAGQILTRANRDAGALAKALPGFGIIDGVPRES